MKELSILYLIFITVTFLCTIKDFGCVSVTPKEIHECNNFNMFASVLLWVMLLFLDPLFIIAHFLHWIFHIEIKDEHMKKHKCKVVDKDICFFRKSLYTEHFIHTDCFAGLSPEPKKFEYDIEVSKCVTLNGIVYEIVMPNCIMHDENYSRLMHPISRNTV